MTDYSQSGEQDVILDWTERRVRWPGRFLDIGAADGETASNTRALALQGWHGVLVEPNGGLFDGLTNLYADNDDVACIQAALVVEPAQLIRFHYTDDLTSTTSSRHRDKWADQVEFRTVYVAAVTVDRLLHEFPGPYDLISVDTEGTSLQLARALLDQDALPVGGLLCVECEDGAERWSAQQWCLDGYARVGITPNNLLLERLR